MNEWKMTDVQSIQLRDFLDELIIPLKYNLIKTLHEELFKYYPKKKIILRNEDEDCCDDFSLSIREGYIREDDYGNLWCGHIPMGVCPFCGYVYRVKKPPRKG